MGKLGYLAILFTVCIATGFTTPLPSKISSTLESRFRNGEKVNIFIRVSASTSSVLQQIRQSRYANREEKLNSIHDLLLRNAEGTQKNILGFLESKARSENVEFKSFWITNQIYVKDADKALVQELVSKFPNDIESVYADEIVAHISLPVDAKNATSRKDAQWGLQKIQVPEAWEELGFRKSRADTGVMPEVRIATLDTGVRYTHEALRDNFMGDYGWFDPTIGEPLPHDRMGHGTHTTGTIAGSLGIGVAPWAKWMSCRGCPTLGCQMHDLLSCGEFFLCPTLSNGSSPDCSKAPHLVSNSWSAGPGFTWFDDVIAAWSAAGIIPIFSLGNMGNAFCGSAYYPGDQENVIGVGSTTQDDDLSWFSSIGQTKTGGLLIKPDVVAPGSDIRSSDNTADDGYSLMSGTSMSCPHVSGIVAMLVTKYPEITFEEVKHALLDSTAINLRSRGLTCLGVPDTKYPNYVYGFGRVNALRSLLRSH